MLIYSLTCPGGIMAQAKYSGIFQSVLTIYSEEGLRGMYRGYSAALCSFPVYWSLYFPTYELVKKHLQEPLQDYPVVAQGVAATITGTAVDVATYPLWFLRTRMHTQHLHQITSANSTGRDGYSTLRSTIATIYKREGPSAFFKGMTASCFGILSYGIQFPVYETLKEQVAIDPTTNKVCSYV
ncbi:hypothetical protein AC1031_021004 [Aphanomyces cochlioides]|nr:hypothetical protein AC1031_021004 [Aphanomyces cochlioides]